MSATVSSLFAVLVALSPVDSPVIQPETRASYLCLGDASAGIVDPGGTQPWSRAAAFNTNRFIFRPMTVTDQSSYKGLLGNERPEYGLFDHKYGDMSGWCSIGPSYSPGLKCHALGELNVDAASGRFELFRHSRFTYPRGETKVDAIIELGTCSRI